MALYTFITGSMAASMTDMVKHLLRVALDKLAAEGKIVGTVDEAMALIDSVEVKEPVLEQAHMWWTGEVNEDNCKAICRAEGRMLQCPLKASGGDYCKKCSRQISTKGKLSFGTVQDRLACDPADYPGVKPYDTYAKRHNITDEQIAQAEDVYGSKCPRLDKKRGRPQKAKIASAADEITINEPIPESDESDSDPVEAEVKAEPKNTESEEEVKEKEKKPRKKKAESEPDAEVKEKEKKPRKKKDKAESDSDGEVKEEKEEKEEKEKKPRKKKEEGEVKADKKSRKKDKAEEDKPQAEVPRVVAAPPPPAEDSEDELEVEEWTHPINGTKYCMAKGNVLYTEDGDRVGVWHEDTQEIV